MNKDYFPHITLHSIKLAVIEIYGREYSFTQILKKYKSRFRKYQELCKNRSMHIARPRMMRYNINRFFEETFNKALFLIYL